MLQTDQTKGSEQQLCQLLTCLPATPLARKPRTIAPVTMLYLTRPQFRNGT